MNTEWAAAKRLRIGLTLCKGAINLCLGSSPIKKRGTLFSHVVLWVGGDWSFLSGAGISKSKVVINSSLTWKKCDRKVRTSSGSGFASTSTYLQTSLPARLPFLVDQFLSPPLTGDFVLLILLPSPESSDVPSQLENSHQHKILITINYIVTTFPFAVSLFPLEQNQEASILAVSNFLPPISLKVTLIRF